MVKNDSSLSEKLKLKHWPCVFCCPGARPRLMQGRYQGLRKNGECLMLGLQHVVATVVAAQAELTVHHTCIYALLSLCGIW